MGGMPQSKTEIPDENHPQLRLHHLFALTAVMAVLLAIQGPQPSDSNAETSPQPFIGMFWLSWVVGQILAAAAITALAFGIARYRRGRAFFNQPGHWLILEISIATLLGIPTSLLHRAIDFSNMRIGSWNMIWMLLFSLYSLLSLGLGRLLLNVYLARKCSELRWKRVFYAKALASLFLGLADFLVIASVLVATRTDRRELSQRDLSHRCGVIVQLGLNSLAIVNVAMVIASLVLLR
jgi:hypothetical protein